MTGVELVQHYFPSADARTADALLWACTPFPFVETRRVVRALQRMARRANGDPSRAFQLSDHVINNCLKRINKHEKKMGRRP